MTESEANPAAQASGRVGAQTRAVLVWKVVEYAGLASFTIVVPRLMRPDLYGSFAALLSVIGLLTLASAMGAQATFGRFVPEYEARGERERTRALFTQLFTLRFVVVSALTVGLLLLSPRALRGASQLTALWGAGAFFCVAIGMVSYQLLFGLNRLGRSLTHDSLIRLVVMILVVELGGARSLERAALALFLSEAAFLLLGLFWVRGFFSVGAHTRDRSALPGQLRLGVTFFAVNLLLMAVWRGGELAVLLFSGRTAEVAFYSVASNIALAFAALLGQLGVMLLPSLTAFHVAGKGQQMTDWLGYALKYLTLAAFAFLLLLHAVGPWLVRHLLGPSYLPVIANLKLLALGLLPVPLVRTGVSLALVRLEGRRALVMAAGGVVAFVAGAAVLVPAMGSVGASIAAAGSLAVTGAIATALFALGPVLAAAQFWRLVAVGLVALGVSFLPLGAALPSGVLALLLFVPLLLAAGVISGAELRRLLGLVGVAGA